MQPERIGTHLQRSCPSGVIRTCLILQQRVVTTHVKCGLPWKCARDSVPRVCIWSWSHKHPRPGTYPKFQTNGKKVGVQHKPHCLFTQPRNRGPVLAVLCMVETLLKSRLQVPGPSQGPAVQAGLSRVSSLRPGDQTLLSSAVITCVLSISNWMAESPNATRLT